MPPRSSGSVVHVARRLAAAHPRAALPCPVCAASLAAGGLEKHLAKVHGGAPDAPRGAPLRLEGRDRAVLSELAVALVLVLAAGLAGIGLGDAAFGVGDAALWVFVAVLVPVLGATLAAMLDAFGSTLRVEGGTLSVRRALGLRAKSLPLAAARLEVGRLQRLRAAPGMQQHEWARHDEVDGGVFVRVTDGRTRITATARRGALAEHWAEAGVVRAAPTRVADVALDAEGWSALAYALADAGLLVPREPS